MSYRAEFVDLLAAYDVVRFGAFTLKSGRTSPYFINTGQLRTGRAIEGLGAAYAGRIAEAGLEPRLVFGPSYKGVPLAVSTAMAMSVRGDADVGFAFDRKEAKDHGEGGVFVGTQPGPGVGTVVVDDVITSGVSIRHSVRLLRGAGARVEGAVIAVDRQERGTGARSSLDELQEELQIPILPIVTVREMVAILRDSERLEASVAEAIEAYVAQHGPRP